MKTGEKVALVAGGVAALGLLYVTTQVNRQPISIAGKPSTTKPKSLKPTRSALPVGRTASPGALYPGGAYRSPTAGGNPVVTPHGKSVLGRPGSPIPTGYKNAPVPVTRRPSAPTSSIAPPGYKAPVAQPPSLLGSLQTAINALGKTTQTLAGRAGAAQQQQSAAGKPSVSAGGGSPGGGGGTAGNNPRGGNSNNNGLQPKSGASAASAPWSISPTDLNLAKSLTASTNLYSAPQSVMPSGSLVGVNASVNSPALSPVDGSMPTSSISASMRPSEDMAGSLDGLPNDVTGDSNYTSAVSSLSVIVDPFSMAISVPSDVPSVPELVSVGDDGGGDSGWSGFE